MLEEIVTAGVHWMQAGLPLSCLKIVLLETDPANTGLILHFKSMKASYQAGKMQKQKVQYDLCCNEIEN